MSACVRIGEPGKWRGFACNVAKPRRQRPACDGAINVSAFRLADAPTRRHADTSFIYGVTDGVAVGATLPCGEADAAGDVERDGEEAGFAGISSHVQSSPV